MVELYINDGFKCKDMVGEIIDYTITYMECGFPIQIVIEFTDKNIRARFHEKTCLLKCIAFKSDRGVLRGYDAEIKKLPDPHKRLVVVYGKMLWGDTLDTALVF